MNSELLGISYLKIALSQTYTLHPYLPYAGDLWNIDGEK